MAEKGVGAANARMTRRDVGMSSDGAVLALETRSKAVANVAGNGALPSETTLADGSQLRFIFKVVKSLSLVMLLPQDDQEGMDLSTLLALHCPEMAADTTGQEVLHQRGERVMLQTVAVSGDSLEALQGVRCSVHVVNSCLVFLPQVRACRAVCGACVPLSPLFLIAVPRCSLLRVLQGVLRVFANALPHGRCVEPDEDASSSLRP